jgi:hypothetical protein
MAALRSWDRIQAVFVEKWQRLLLQEEWHENSHHDIGPAPFAVRL